MIYPEQIIGDVELVSELHVCDGTPDDVLIFIKSCKPFRQKRAPALVGARATGTSICSLVIGTTSAANRPSCSIGLLDFFQLHRLSLYSSLKDGNLVPKGMSEHGCFTVQLIDLLDGSVTFFLRPRVGLDRAGAKRPDAARFGQGEGERHLGIYHHGGIEEWVMRRFDVRKTQTTRLRFTGT